MTNLGKGANIAKSRGYGLERLHVGRAAGNVWAEHSRHRDYCSDRGHVLRACVRCGSRRTGQNGVGRFLWDDGCLCGTPAAPLAFPSVGP